MTKRTRKERLHAALDAFLHESLHPDEYDQDTGARLRRTPNGRVHSYWNQYAGRSLPAPRYRLMRRLQLLTALREWDLKLMKEILADEEATSDAKAHKEQQDADAARAIEAST